MTVTATALRELHRIHRQLSDLRSRLGRGPKQIRAGENRVAVAETEFNTAKQTQTAAKIASDDKQLQLKQREDRIEDLKAKLNTANSNKEYQTLKEQIAADLQANSVLSDEILEMLDKIENQQAELTKLHDEMDGAGAELAKVRGRVDGEREGLESELNRVTEELKQVETSLPVDFRRDYDRISQARGEDALAQVDGETCGGCFTTLTPQTMNELYLAKPVFCKSCGCLLYLPENRSVGGK